MMRVLVWLCFAFFAGCSVISDFDGFRFGANDAGSDGAVDAGRDAAVDAGRDRATSIQLTSGGGQTSSPRYRARIHIGTPQPMGTVSSSRHRLNVGPGAIGPRTEGQNE